MRIFLIGYMGCGKTTVGRKLARRLHVPFYDTDSMAEEVEGASVNDIFRYEGEERFRTLEREAVERIIAAGEAAVVSTGGGLPLWRDNMERMNGAGHTIYIRRSAERIARRLTPYGRQKRPRLRGLGDEEIVDFMRRDISDREPCYARSRQTVDGDRLSDDELIETIMKTLPQ